MSRQFETRTPDAELVAKWRAEPAPLLPLLLEFQERDGYLTREAIHAISEGMRIPLAELYGTITFYHHLSTEPPGIQAPRVCDGPVCRRRGSRDLIEALSSEGASPMPCAGRCDDPIPVLRGTRSLIGQTAEALAPRTSPLPPPPADGIEECVFRHIRSPGRATLEGYRETGGYAGLERMIGGSSPTGVIEEVTRSGLAGRGGAGFPTGRKWQAVSDAPGLPKTIVCNADEGEPGCFKDRALMDHDPHALIEGMAAAAFATGAERGFIYLRYEYPETFDILARALEEARTASVIGDDLLGSGQAFHIHLRRGAGAYICGEETSLLNSLEGKHPFPRNRPPFPVTHGYEDLPTVVNNVETLCSVPQILRKGATWYGTLGHGEHAGTKVISLSGDVRRPGNYEVPIGLPLRTLLDEWAGGPLDGRTLQAVTMAGLSGGFLGTADFDVTLDEPSIRARGSFLGAGGVMVFDDRRDMVAVARESMEFFAHESCGKCFPCRIGTQRLAERLAGSAGPKDGPAWHQEVRDIGNVMKATSACGLGTAAPLITDSLMERFPQALEAHLEGRPEDS